MFQKLLKRCNNLRLDIVTLPNRIAWWSTDALENAALAILRWARKRQIDLMGEGDD